ncbi:cell death activator CIDE-3 [Solea senegalensis]|uniref:Cell death activator CIDE-3 n=1 Tax=Solea senegalensis TaxID=28829 RepID=A0AAV6QK13_SOLSE|nr:cell death activator CIDE-3-like isoform X2 [Solea senegalensis]KAG7493463.1 cell death activator CIDE-3 [Solea senegalensis]
MLSSYTMNSLSLLTPSSLSRCVSASALMTQQLLFGLSVRNKSFRVTNADRSVKKGIIADSLETLVNKASFSLNVTPGSLVLDEDGTDVETEEFFETLQNNSVLMLLDMGEKWSPHPNCLSRGHVCKHRPLERTDVATVTFDLYKNNPKDFIGCLNVKATLYGVYTMSYEVQCYAAKKMLKEALRWTVLSMQATGHILLGSSGYIEQLLEDEEEEEEEEEEEQQAEKKLPLPQKGRMRQLQHMLLGRMSYW